MANTGKTTTHPLSRRAQAIIELAVFGAIFIFMLGSIFQQGYSTMQYQQSQLQPMRMALLASYNATNNGDRNDPQTYKRNSVSLFVVEDRISPGAAKYGAVDRRPTIMVGSGTLSKGLFYPVEWVDLIPPIKNVIGVTDVYVNGQRFEMTSSAVYYLRLRRTATKVTLARIPAPDVDPCSPGTPLLNVDSQAQRLWWEWNGGTGNFYTQKAKGNTGYGANSAAQFNYNRNYDPVTGAPKLDDDIFANYPGEWGNALWKWVVADVTTGGLESDATSLSADVNGDLTEETVFPKEAKGLRACAAGPLAGAVYDFAVQDSGAGDMAGEGPDGYANLEDAPGLKMDSGIYTKMEDGTVLEMRNGSGYIPGTNKLAMSKNKKVQYDVISRTWQLNRRMVDPQNFVDRNWNLGLENWCGDPGALTPPGNSGCCMFADKVMTTCFDMGSRTLYIRSRIQDNRGRMWINNINIDKAKALVGMK